MAKLSHSQAKSASRISRASAQRFGLSTPLLGITGLLLLILAPLALQVYGSSELQRWLVPVVRQYLPPQFQAYLQESEVRDEIVSLHESLSPEELLQACHIHQYTSEVISLSPLVIYINNFTSAAEADELINIGSDDFAESFISRSRGANQKVTGRTSSSAPLPLEHPLVDCILGRARRFMGSMMLPYEPFSIPQLVRYFPSQKYDLHTDFWPEHQIMNDGSNRLFNRVASFFVFLRDNCTEGYTYFPHVEPAYQTYDTDLQKVYGDKVQRGELNGEEKGVKFKPIQGNAIFWVNVDEKGNGDRRLLHAGLPVGEGEKIGLNIWPRKYFGKIGEEEEEQKRERKGWNGKWS